MKLTEVMSKVTGSSREDWHTIECWGADSGPSYRGFTDAEERGPGVGKSHSVVATYIPDARITMAWGLKVRDHFDEDWVKNFALRPEATMALVDIFFCGSLVYREYYVTVDGGRMPLPIPDPDNKSVPTGYASFVALLHSLHGGAWDFMEYFKRAGFVETSKVWPAL